LQIEGFVIASGADGLRSSFQTTTTSPPSSGRRSFRLLPAAAGGLLLEEGAAGGTERGALLRRGLDHLAVCVSTDD
jgi:hypothetical protein